MSAPIGSGSQHTIPSSFSGAAEIAEQLSRKEVEKLRFAVDDLVIYPRLVEINSAVCASVEWGMPLMSDDLTREQKDLETKRKREIADLLNMTPEEVAANIELLMKLAYVIPTQLTEAEHRKIVAFAERVRQAENKKRQSPSAQPGPSSGSASSVNEGMSDVVSQTRLTQAAAQRALSLSGPARLARARVNTLPTE